MRKFTCNVSTQTVLFIWERPVYRFWGIWEYREDKPSSYLTTTVKHQMSVMYMPQNFGYLVQALWAVFYPHRDSNWQRIWPIWVRCLQAEETDKREDLRWPFSLQFTFHWYLCLKGLYSFCSHFLDISYGGLVENGRREKDRAVLEHWKSAHFPEISGLVIRLGAGHVMCGFYF